MDKTFDDNEDQYLSFIKNSRIEGMFTNNSTPIAYVNQDMTFDEVNDAFCLATGYTHSELLQMRWDQLLTEDIVEQLKTINQQRLVNPKCYPDDYEISYYNKSGEKQYAQMAVSFFPALKKRLVAFLVITKQKRALREIEERTAMLQKEVTLKDIEITNYLLKLSNNNKLGEQIWIKLKAIGDKLVNENSSLVPDVNDLLSDMEFYHKSSFWATLDEHFIQTHPQFTKNLLSRHPGITPAEIKLATLLSLQLNTKDIANIMIQSYDSIRVSRSRLRKKLGLKNGNSLQTYLFTLL